MPTEVFWNEQAKWSQETFGADSKRGPKGPLKHLAKEVQEALVEHASLEAAILMLDTRSASLSKQRLDSELVDCLFLVFDAARRSGMSYGELVQGAFEKLEINRNRKWNKPTSDEPVEHVRE